MHLYRAGTRNERGQHPGGASRRERDGTGMNTTHASTGDQDEPARYEIRLKGHLDNRRAEWFEGLTITLEANGETLLAGPVIDQAALHGLLRRVRDLGLPLLSVMKVDPEQAGGSEPDADRDHHRLDKETLP
jgi:hypothetical protein